MTRPPPTFAEALVAVARGELGVRETVGMPNRGPRVDEYLRAVGLDPTRGSYPWCAAGIYWTAKKAAKLAGVPVPIPRTASVHRLMEWAKANDFWIEGHVARADQSLIQPGYLWCADHGRGKGHVEIVIGVVPSGVETIGYNTNGDGARDGDGVFLKSRPTAAAAGFVRL